MLLLLLLKMMRMAALCAYDAIVPQDLALLLSSMSELEVGGG